MKTSSLYARLHKQQTAGFALLLSIIVASVVLAIGISILKTSVSQLQLSATGRESEISFQASQSVAECMMHARFTEEAQFTARPGGFEAGTELAAPPVTCMGKSAMAQYAEVITNATDNHIVRFHYTYSWGSTSELCSEADMYVMVPRGDDVSYTFAGTSVGENGDGVKVCTDSTVCTILITQGYNRACDELETSIFTVQRELTTEF